MFDNSLLIESELAYRREIISKGIARKRRGRTRAAWARRVAAAQFPRRDLAE